MHFEFHGVPEVSPARRVLFPERFAETFDEFFDSAEILQCGLRG